MSFTLKAIIPLLGASLFINIVLWLLVLLVFPHNNPTAILHYSIDIGIDFIGASKQIIVLPVTGLIILFGNTALGAALWRTDAKTAWIFWSVIPSIQLILLGSFILIWQANV